MADISYSEARKFLKADFETGKLYWRERSPRDFANCGHSARHSCTIWNSRYAGKEAFTANSHGYKSGSILGKRFLAHRIIWLLAHKRLPDGAIDHINGNPSDNRLSNLRVVTMAQNMRNQSLRVTNSTGAHGVAWYKPTKKWRVRIQANGHIEHIGYFDLIDEAIAARKIREEELGFHVNHGRVNLTVKREAPLRSPRQRTQTP